MAKWYIVFGTHALCVPGTVDLIPFDSQAACQAHIDENCQGADFRGQDFEFIEATDPQAVFDYVRTKA